MDGWFTGLPVNWLIGLPINWLIDLLVCWGYCLLDFYFASGLLHFRLRQKDPLQHIDMELTYSFFACCYLLLLPVDSWRFWPH